MLSFVPYMIQFRAAIVIDCLFRAIKCVVSRSQKSIHDSMNPSERSLNHGYVGLTKVIANNLHLKGLSIQ